MEAKKVTGEQLAARRSVAASLAKFPDDKVEVEIFRRRGWGQEGGRGLMAGWWLQGGSAHWWPICRVCACVCTEHMWRMNGTAYCEQLGSPSVACVT